MGLGKVTLIGNLGGDAELRYLPAGTAVSNFSVAVTNKSGGAKEDKTLWYRVALFGKLGESLTPYLTKGKQVYVEGLLDLRTYQNKQGEKAFSLEVTAREIQLLGQRGSDDEDEEDEPTPAPAPVVKAKASTKAKAKPAPAATEDDDLFTFTSDDDSVPF